MKAKAEPPIDFDAEAFIAAVPWTFAKTVPHMPHEYVIRGWEGVPDDGFDAFVELIQAEGYRARWYHPDRKVWWTNHYLEVGEFKYWFIPPRMLNREHLSNSTTERLDD